MLTFLKQRSNAKFKFKLISLIILSIILLFSMSEWILENAIKEMKEDINTKFDSIEHNLSSIFQNSKHTLYNIATILLEEEISEKNKKAHTIFSYFATRSLHNPSLPLTGIVLIDKNQNIIVNTITNSEIHNKTQDSKDSICLKRSNKKDPFELKIFPMLEGMYIKKPIIPLIMTITDINKEYIGTVCAGIYTNLLNNKLSERYTHTKYFDHINLLNNKNNDPGAHYIFHDIENAFTTSSILNNYLKNHDMIVHRDLKNYPFTVELEIKPAYLNKSLRIYCLFLLEYFTLFIIFSFLLYLIVRNYYRAPLLLVSKKLTVINEFINKKPVEILANSGRTLLSREFYPDQFANAIYSLIDSYYLLVERTAKQPELEIKERILNLILTEQHFLSSNRSAATSEEKLYINKLVSIIDEEYITMSLVDFLTKVADYCSEFYHEISLKIEVQKKDNKNFTFKHAALVEAIFNILTFIIRGNFDIHNNKLIIRGKFVNKNDFPSIALEANISNKTSTTLGWSSGPSYVYTSLLSIYLLAKENSLFFDIRKKDNKIFFTLKSMDQKIELYSKARLIQAL